MAAISLIPCQTPTQDQCSLSTTGAPTPDLPLPNELSQADEKTEKFSPHRSHDPDNNLKRSDPFQFGSRYLQENDNVFEFNAWDHVIPDSSYYEYAETQYDFQRASPVSDFDKKRFNDQPQKWWNKFYSNNTTNFFKDRKWLHQEFPILSQLTKADAPPTVVMEVGAGAGNTAFPILKANENHRLMLHACDFSSKAVELLKANEAYDPAHMLASVWDVSSNSLPDEVKEASVDVVILVFIFSALNPKQWDAAVRNVWRLLKPGGEVCFRDYGKGDLTQVRFKKGRLMEENFYIRGDGTRVYFFEESELRHIWSGGVQTSGDLRSSADVGESGKETVDVDSNHQDGLAESESESKSKSQDALDDAPSQIGINAFDILSLGVDRRMLVNRQKQLKMYRCWVQGRFKKPIPDEEIP